MHPGPPEWESGPRRDLINLRSVVAAKRDTWTITPPRRHNVAPVPRSAKKRGMPHFVNASVYPCATMPSRASYVGNFIFVALSRHRDLLLRLGPPLLCRGYQIVLHILGYFLGARPASLDIRAAPAPETSESIRNSCGQFDSRARHRGNLRNP